MAEPVPQQKFYHYGLTSQPDGSGMGVWAFIMPTSLPLFMTSGAGTPSQFRWNPLQPNQIYHNLEQRQDGQIGIVAGQVAMQPLIDNRDMGING